MNEIAKHCWKSACLPNDKASISWKTFSISFDQIVPKASGKGTKLKPVGFRLTGPTNRCAEVCAAADEIVKMLDNGWKPSKKTATWKP